MLGNSKQTMKILDQFFSVCLISLLHMETPLDIDRLCNRDSRTGSVHRVATMQTDAYLKKEKKRSYISGLSSAGRRAQGDSWSTVHPAMSQSNQHLLGFLQ